MPAYKGEKGELTRRQKEFLESQEAGRRESEKLRKALKDIGRILIGQKPESEGKK